MIPNRATQTTASPFSDWIQKVRSQGKSEEEIGALLAGVAKLSAMDVYAALLTALTEEDMKTVEAIPDDGQARAKMEELFKLRTGMTVDELVTKTQSAFAVGYFKVENQSVTPPTAADQP